MLPPARSRWPLAALAVLTLLGAALRLWQARESLWLDELHTAWCALGSLAEVAPRAAIGNQSPLFFWLEWLLVKLLGSSELTVRLPSLVAGSLLPVVLYELVRRWTRDAWLGVLAAWLVVVDPVQIFYATEARPYALVQLLAAVHVGLLAELIVRPRLWLHALFVGVGAVIFHLHYTAALLFLAEIGALVVRKSTVRDRDVCSGPLALAFLAIALLCLPATPHVLAVFERRANWELFVPRPRLQDLVTLLPWSWTAIVVLAAVAFRWYQSPESAANKERSFAPVLALCWLLIPLLAAFALTWTDVARLFFLRYLIAIAPAGIVLAALAVGQAPWPRIRAAIGAVVAITALILPAISAVPQLASDGRLIADRRGDWRSATAHFNRQLGHEQCPVLVATQLIESEALRGSTGPALTEYCLYPVHSLYPIAADPDLTIPLPRTSPGQLSPATAQLVRDHGGAWLVFAGSGDNADKAAREVIHRVQSPSTKGGSSQAGWSTHRDSFGTVHIIRLSANQANP